EELAIEAAKLLDERKMVRFNPESGNLAVTNMGRVASHFYIRNQSVATFNEMMEQKRDYATDADLLHIMCCADEFENLRVRPEELDEVDKIKKVKFYPGALTSKLPPNKYFSRNSISLLGGIEAP
ncbi:hypothetical protein THAOC_12711, partial [Thalassiosira oceanica]